MLSRLLAAMLSIFLLTAAHYEQHEAVWQVKCDYVTSNKDDPIVFPDEPGVSHRHDYFGTPANARTSTQKLLDTKSHCAFGGNSFKAEPNDHAGYWVPAILYRNRPINMSQAKLDAYYFLGNNHPPVQPFPLGLRMIAGNSHATSPQPTNIVRMKCVDDRGGEGPIQSSIPDCRHGRFDKVAIVVLFPECWDGEHLDSSNHKSHMAYATSSGCPNSHPVKVPKLSVRIVYRGEWQGGRHSEFSSDGVYSAHADFWNAWVPARQRELVDACLNEVRNCRFIDV